MLYRSLMCGGVFVLLVLAAAPGAAGEEKAMPEDCTVACYYFPNYHIDARNAARHGEGWTEWELVRMAQPRFEGHRQPNVPYWGYCDEADPRIMQKKIDAAADFGVDAWIFDWYWYDDGPFLQNCLDYGFMRANNNHRIRFALMWANHTWIDIHPATLLHPPEVLYPGTVTPETFDTICDHVIEHYFKHPAYWRIDGKPYFSIYELHTLIESFGDSARTREALDRFRAKAVAAGLPGIHLNGVAFGLRILPGETAAKNPEELVAYLGFDSVTSYVWVHDAALSQFPQTPYTGVLETVAAKWPEEEKRYPVPYYPNVTMGWDASPRCLQSDPLENKGYPFMATLSENTPENFQAALERCRDFLAPRPPEQRILTVNCWNEWTEGSYLEPDVAHGFAYLKALQAVFPNH